MTSTEFVYRCGEILGRHGWRIRFSKATGVSYATVKRWGRGELPVPEYAVVIVEFLEAVPRQQLPTRWRESPPPQLVISPGSLPPLGPG